MKNNDIAVSESALNQPYSQSDWECQLDLLQNPTREQLARHLAAAPSEETNSETCTWLRQQLANPESFTDAALA